MDTVDTESIYLADDDRQKMACDDSGPDLVSDYVHNLANAIYKEFESLIMAHGETVVKNLMPMVVSCLETLDRVFSEKHRTEVEFELLKEDSSQLMSQYEREKSLRKKAEENLLRTEDGFVDKMGQYEDRIRSLESHQKMSEIRLKNSHEQIIRLEEREVERQSETERLYTRYHELMRFHVECLERAKGGHGNSATVSDVSKSLHLEKAEFGATDSLSVTMAMRADLHDTRSATDNYFGQPAAVGEPFAGGGRLEEHYMRHPYDDWDLISNRSGQNSTSDVDDFFSNNRSMALDEELTGMSREIESIIKENNELVATKNALNIVKDDLISKLDEANSEIEILQNQINYLSEIKISLKMRCNDLDMENKNLKQEVANLKGKCEQNVDETSVPISQRKRFTRIEMARVLMERNQYKERVNELEEYVKWAKKLNESEKKLTVWQRFSRLFKSSPAPASKQISKAAVTPSKNVRPVLPMERPVARQKVHGWFIPTNCTKEINQNLPLPIYSKSLLETHGGLKVVSAVVVDAVSTTPSDGSQRSPTTPMNKPIGDQITELASTPDSGLTNRTSFPLPGAGSSNCNHIWIAAASPTESQIVIMDVSRPQDCVDSFCMTGEEVQCLAFVSGVDVSDDDDDLINSSIVGDLSPVTDIDTDSGIPNFAAVAVDCGLPDSSSGHSSPMKGSPTTNQQFTSAQPTVWIGCKSGDLFIHPACGLRSLCLAHLRLSKAVTAISHDRSRRVFISLADGSLAIFSRYNHQDGGGQWCVGSYRLLQPDSTRYAIRCLSHISVTSTVWMGYRNCVIVLDPRTASVVVSFEAHPQQEHSVRQLCCVGYGVWVSLQLDTVLRMFHVETHQHLQDVHMEAHIARMIIEPSVFGVSLLRVTCVSTVCQSLWVGFNNGMIFTLPFVSGDSGDNTIDTTICSLPPSSSAFIPIVNTQEIQLSHHGFRDIVKFIVTTASSKDPRRRVFVVAAGQGYRDHRLDKCESAFSNSVVNSLRSVDGRGPVEKARDSSHIIVWEMNRTHQ